MSHLAAPTNSRASGDGIAAVSGRRGLLIINADDWGYDRLTTNRILDCTRAGSVSSVSAMVLMDDSERAAEIARAEGIDAGLHLNFTTAFSAGSARLRQRQQATAGYLLRHRFAQATFHPGLMRSFEYVAAAQMDEFRRLYGTDPARVDGHHHMHLCANVLLQRLLPQGAIVRRSFSFARGEKGFANRFYRSLIDRSLARRHRIADGFYSLVPLEPAARLEKIFSAAADSVIELETHPAQPVEHAFLLDGVFAYTRNLTTGPFRRLLRPQEPTPANGWSIAGGHDQRH